VRGDGGERPADGSDTGHARHVETEVFTGSLTARRREKINDERSDVTPALRPNGRL
jgi:hypothetical protein